jgi:ribonuclease R
MTPERFHDPILNYLGDREGEPTEVGDIADSLRIPPHERGVFEQAVEQLATLGRVVWGQGRTVALPPLGNRVTGTYRQTARGFGFVVPDEANSHGDLFIPAGENNGAVTGDFVSAKVIVRDKYDTGNKKNVFGRVLEILKRGTHKAVGTVIKVNGRWAVQPDGNIFRNPILAPDAGSKNTKEGDKVVIELIRFPQMDDPGEGVILEILGEAGEPDVELESVIRQFDLPAKFPEAVQNQAADAARSFNPKDFLGAGGEREDLSRETIITIDPDDAKDYDDAISLKILDTRAAQMPRKPEPQADGDEQEEHDVSDEEVDALLSEEAGKAVYELGVHIADVSAFVGVNTAMDMEARTRGNSTYFPRFVIPMLPEVLSNGVCSLQEAQPRLTKTAFIRYDARGRVVGTRFANTIIKSKKRLTYTQAQAIIDDAKGEGQPYTKGLLEVATNPNVPQVEDDVRHLLVHMDRLARLIRQRRLAQGMIVLDLPEVELVMDDTGRVIDAQPEDDAFTHKIIEMFMVEANEAVARWLTRANLPVMRRIHPEPEEASTEQVRQFMLIAGRRVPKTLDKKGLQALLDSVRGTPVSHSINLAVLKTFTTAEYSPQEVGHYALASDNYAHFTSPIRRYADLVIHREFDAVLAAKKSDGGGKKKKRGGGGSAEVQYPAPSAAGERRGAGMMPETLTNTPDYNTLLNLGKHLNYTERRSQDAEREIRAVKVLQLLSEHVGDVIDGVVTGVTNFGVFVQSTRFLAEGMIRTADLPDDFWQLDDRTGVLRGQRSGRRIALGDRVRVQIVNVNIPARQLEFRLLEHGSSISNDQSLKRMEPRNKPKPFAHTQREEFAQQPRKKNHAKRLSRKERARRQAQSSQSNDRNARGRHDRGGRGRRGRRR